MSIEISPARPDHASGIASVHVAAWLEAYAHILPVEELTALGHRGFVVAKREPQWEKILEGHHSTYVAMDKGSVVGFASVGRNERLEVPTDGELKAIYVHPDAHRRGIGRALLKAAVTALLEQGMTGMSVALFRDNYSATSFYKANGAEFCLGSEYEVEGVSYPDVIYLWKSLAELHKSLESA
jgi:GNAT superfamily N-acetyltransferase